MSKKERIAELEQRIAELERELNQYRKRENLTYSEPSEQTIYVLKQKDVGWRIRPRWFVEPFESSTAVD